MTVEIKLLSQNNRELLSNLGEEVFDEKIRAEYLEAFLSCSRHVMFVALDGDLVVGMASGVEYFHPDKPPQLWINEVGVATTHRRRGIARSLVEALIAVAEERGCVYAWLGTELTNKVAQACFSSVPDVEPAQPFLLYEWDLEED